MAAVSKQEYLKRYLSNSVPEKKKKKKKGPKMASKRPSSFIVDDDITLKDVAVSNAEQAKIEFEDDADEAPAVYEDDGVTKISIETFKKREEDKKNKWAPISRKPASSPDRREGQNVDYDSDNSPPRSTVRRRQDTPDLSPRRDSLRQGPGQSPVRIKQERNSPSRRERLDDSPDLSPHRRRQMRSPFRKTANDLSSTNSERRETLIQAEKSPPRSHRRRHDSGDSMQEQTRDGRSYLSPSRQQNYHRASRSAGRRARHDSPDISPQRKGIKTNSHLSAARKRTNHDSNEMHRTKRTNSDSDQSPPRKRTNSDSDQSPPRKRTNSDSDQSPPRKRTNSDSDQSPPRKRSNRDSDQSPPRKQKQFEVRSTTKSGSENRMSSGRKAGLLSASDLKKENERKRKEEADMYSKMDPSTSGKGSETVYRDKMGRKKDIKMDRIKRREEERKELEDSEKFMEWGRGVVQTKETQDKVADYLHEVDKPLARYRDDKDLEEMLKDQEREDPMLAYMKQKKKKTRHQGRKERFVYVFTLLPASAIGLLIFELDIKSEVFFFFNEGSTYM
ncbi:BUD13 homolog isoform X3 [Montipora capricornis]|uniref:BUD13 homolog isoform X3 n=1 Tax=Montipora capricornis TaxID=246305 RepID=UPI0035F12434